MAGILPKLFEYNSYKNFDETDGYAFGTPEDIIVKKLQRVPENPDQLIITLEDRDGGYVRTTTMTVEAITDAPDLVSGGFSEGYQGFRRVGSETSGNFHQEIYPENGSTTSYLPPATKLWDQPWIDAVIYKAVFTGNKNLLDTNETHIQINDKNAPVLERLRAYQDGLVDFIQKARIRQIDANIFTPDEAEVEIEVIPNRDLVSDDMLNDEFCERPEINKNKYQTCLLELERIELADNFPQKLFTRPEEVGVPICEIAFTARLLGKARELSEALGLTEETKALLKQEIKFGGEAQETEFDRATAFRGHLADWFDRSSRIEMEYDRYDDLRGLTEEWYWRQVFPPFGSTRLPFRRPILIGPPLEDSSPFDLATLTTRDATQQAVATLVEEIKKNPDYVSVLFDAVLTNMRDHPEKAAQLAEAFAGVLDNPTVREKFAGLVHSSFEFGEAVGGDPQLSGDIERIQQQVGSWTQSLSAISQQAFDNLKPQVLALTSAIVRQGVSSGISEMGSYLQTHPDKIESISRSIALAILRTARDENVLTEGEDTALALAQKAAEISQKPEFHTAVNTIGSELMEIGVESIGALLLDENNKQRVADIIAAAMEPLFDGMAKGLEGPAKKALAKLFSKIGVAIVMGAMQSLDDPDLAPVRALVEEKVILPMQNLIERQLMSPRERAKADRTARKAERKRTMPTYASDRSLHASFEYEDFENPAFTMHGNIRLHFKDKSDAVVEYAVSPAGGVSPYGGMIAKLDVSKFRWGMSKIGAVFTKFYAHGDYFTREQVLDAYLLLDGQGRTGMAFDSGITDEFGNSGSFRDADGRIHYINFQRAIVLGKKVEYLLDLWLEPVEVQSITIREVGQDDTTREVPKSFKLAWDVFPISPEGLGEYEDLFGLDTRGLTDFVEFGEGNLNKNSVQPQHQGGTWEIIDTDGDGFADYLSWGAAVEGTAWAQNLLPGQFCSTVVDMANIINENIEKK